jgi:predicted signal transduction protein with EAL and GGDEF domain
VRPGDTVARLGGDEFAILLDEISVAADTTRVADRIQKELNLPCFLDGHSVSISASIGITLSSARYERAEDLLRDADIAMYRAKTTGKARHQIFDAGMHAAVASLLELEADLRKAIQNEEFQVYYQPLISLASGEVLGTEALLRWFHPNRGLLAPSAFITVLEETGLIVPVGEWVLRTACRQNKAWQDAGFPHLRIAVNFSARQFQIKNLVKLVKSVLVETGMAADSLEIEITESTAVKDVELTLKTLNQLHKLGVNISLDDFGSGYSALGYLNQYPFQTLKADRSFISDIPNDTKDTAITAAIIAMAHSLKLRVVAEGVETIEQLDFLRSNKCDEVQGFLFSRPISANELTSFLRKKHHLPTRDLKGANHPRKNRKRIT